MTSVYFLGQGVPPAEPGTDEYVWHTVYVNQFASEDDAALYVATTPND